VASMHLIKRPDNKQVKKLRDSIESEMRLVKKPRVVKVSNAVTSPILDENTVEPSLATPTSTDFHRDISVDIGEILNFDLSMIDVDELLNPYTDLTEDVINNYIVNMLIKNNNNKVCYINPLITSNFSVP